MSSSPRRSAIGKSGRDCASSAHGLLYRALPGPGGSSRGPRNHDRTIIPETMDTMWGTDLTTTFTGEGQAAVFIAADHFTAECVGIHASARATRFEALARRAAALRRVRQRRRARPRRAARSRIAIYVGPLLKGARLPRDREFACLRPSIRGERVRRALHPNAQGEPVMGKALRDDRGTPSGPAGVSRGLQYDVADRAARISHARAVPSQADSTGRQGGVGFKSGARNRGRNICDVAEVRGPGFDPRNESRSSR